jgi:hypothetical protein
VLVTPAAGSIVGRPDTDRLHRAYDIHGMRVRVASDDPTVLRMVHETYASFEAPDEGGGWLDFAIFRGTGDAWIVRTPDGTETTWATATNGVIALFDTLVATIIGHLHDMGIYAVHAGAVADDRGTVVVAGRSGQGKTTLVLGLLSRKFRLLSDELALFDPPGGRILAYRRSVHVRPGTIALLPDLAVLQDRPRGELGGGSEWAVRPEEISAILGGSPADLPVAAEIGAVIVLDGTPDPSRAPGLQEISPAIAALELLRGTWAASVDFGGTLDALSSVISRVPCARLRVGDLNATLDAIIEWRSSNGR